MNPQPFELIEPLPYYGVGSVQFSENGDLIAIGTSEGLIQVTNCYL